MGIMKPTIVVDTREQDPWMFAGRLAAVSRGALRSGDYSLHGRYMEIAIERKSKADLFGSMTTGRVRFFSELARLQEIKRSYLIVEASVESVMRGSVRTSVNPSRMLDTLFHLCAQYGVHPVFCEGRAHAEDMAYGLLSGYWRHCGGR